MLQDSMLQHSMLQCLMLQRSMLQGDVKRKRTNDAVHWRRCTLTI